MRKEPRIYEQDSYNNNNNIIIHSLLFSYTWLRLWKELWMWKEPCLYEFINKNLVHIYMNKILVYEFIALFIFMVPIVKRAINVKRAMNTWTGFVNSWLFSHSGLWLWKESWIWTRSFIYGSFQIHGSDYEKSHECEKGHEQDSCSYIHGSFLIYGSGKRNRVLWKNS